MSDMARLLYCSTLLLLALLPAGPAFSGGAGYYPNGQVQWEYLYQDGQVREAKWYDESGRLNSRTTFQDGRQTTSEGYRSDGALEWQAREMADGRQEITRFDDSRRPTMRYQVAAGQTDGVSTLFYRDGPPRQMVTFRGGILHGLGRTFYENGRIESEYAYRDGELDGSYRLFSPDGQLTGEHRFEKGQQLK